MYTLTRRNPMEPMRGYDPFREMEEMKRAFFGEEFRPVRYATDIADKGDAFLVQTDLPGFKKEDIHIDVEGDILTVKASRNEEQNEVKDGYVRRERRLGSYTRSFDISQVDADAITGDYTDGVLTLNLPKLAPKENTVRHIELA